MKNIDRKKFITSLTVAGVGIGILDSFSLFGAGLPEKITRIGIIGLDTSQVTMIISHINNIKGEGFDVVQPVWGDDLEGFRVVAAYPYAVSYTHLRAHETGRNLVCRLLL